MRFLLVHNRYQRAGGEDAVFRAEAGLLGAAGHAVVEYVRANEEIAGTDLMSRAALATNTVWSRSSARALRRLLHRVRPDVAHFHNTLPLISPAAYYECRAAGVPVVQTLHNYRLICPAANLFRAGRICEECIDRGLHRGVRHACYRHSRSATGAVVAMLSMHRVLNTWRDAVDVYIALSHFARLKFIAAGLPADKVVVKPNFVDPDPGQREGPASGAVFIGRLSPEKGVRTMLEAWRRLEGKVPLEVIGDGPERPEMEALAKGLDNVRFRGHLPRQDAIATTRRARFLIFPSGCYEGFGMAIIEAFACGVPVIASRLGAMQEIVDEGRTGLHFTAGDASDLAAQIEWAWSHPMEMEAMGRAARAEFEAKYTAHRNYDMLMGIYTKAFEAAAHGSAVRAHVAEDARLVTSAEASDS